MAFDSFCGLLSLQVGSAIMATVFFTIAALTFGVNVFNYTQHPENSWPVDLLIICIFVALMVLAGILIFMAAYKESRRLCSVALAVIVLLLIYWLILTIFSFVNQPADIRRVCLKHRCGESFWLISLKYRRRMNEIDKLGIPLGVNVLKINTFDSGSFIRRRTINSNSAHSTMLSIITRRSSFTRITALFTTVIPTTDSAGTTNRSSTTMTTNKSTDHITNDNIPTIPATLLINRERTNVLSPLLNVSPIKATKTSTDKKPVAYNSLDFNILHKIKRQIEHQQKYELSKFHKSVFDYDFEFEELDNNGKEEDTNPSRDMRQIYTHRLGLPLVGAVLFTSINFLFFIFSFTMILSYYFELKTAHHSNTDSRIPSDSSNSQI